MKATQILRYKLELEHRDSKRVGIFEIVVWDVGKSFSYPDGIKYRAWLTENGETVLGFDNHKPKGPHIHFGQREVSYEYKGLEQLQADMKKLIELEGYVYES